jgi:hypothetical protein
LQVEGLQAASLETFNLQLATAVGGRQVTGGTS